jgi:ParB family transcriptional regulator, chromosome partitioning protein
MMTSDKLCTVNIGDIKVPTGRRATDSETIEKLVDSIATVGLLNPILVRAADVGDTSNQMILVAGRHRLEALKVLGRQQVQCAVLADDDLQAELAEIDENLCRAELTPAQSAVAITRRKKIYVALHPDTAAGKAQARAMNVQLGRGDVADKLSPTFAVATAAASGMNSRTIERAAARGEAITTEKLAKIAGTSLDKGVELDALAKIPAEKRDELIDAATRGERVSARASPALEASRKPSVPDPSDYDAQLDRLEAAWEAASDSARVQFGFEVLGLGEAAYSLPKQGPTKGAAGPALRT